MPSTQVFYIICIPKHIECGISSLCNVGQSDVKTWMEGTNDIPYQNSYFFVT